jgi:collagenase-like PrtC family protease
MQLIVQVHSEASLAASLEAGAAGVAVRLPRAPTPEGLSEIKTWQAAARRRHRRFSLLWDYLVAEADFPQALELLEAIASISPDALTLRDLGLTRETRRRYPQLVLKAAGNWGFHNSPGLKLAAALGFSQAVLQAPVGLTDLALLRRQSSLPLELELPPFCAGYPGLCLASDCLGLECPGCCRPLEPVGPAEFLMPALEKLAGLAQLGVEAVRVRSDFFEADALAQVLGLYQAVGEAPASDRAGVLAAARQVLESFGDRFRTGPPREAACPGPPPAKSPAWPAPSAPQPVPERLLRRGVSWLEARGYPEAAALAREWRDPLLLELTRDNYAAFLPELRRWGPRRLIWRLPPIIPESALPFYRKALETLRQGGYSRLVAADWGAAALAFAAGFEVFGDQTLGVRNTPALEAARAAGVARVCLPPASRPADWQQWLSTAPPGRFWSYLYHVPALAVCPRTAPTPPPPAPGLRWVTCGEHLCLSKESPEHLEAAAERLSRQGVAPLVVSLPRSRLPWGKVPVLAASNPRHPPRPRR